MQYLDTKAYLNGDILVKVDRMSMATSLEMRSPLLDHKFVEFAASLTPDWKYRGRSRKYILRNSPSALEFLPRSFTERNRASLFL